MKPAPVVTPNTWEFLRDPMIAPTGFREYDARWKYPEEINLPGMTALGLGLGTQIHRRGIEPVIAVGNDYRDYSLSIKNALILGLVQAGIRVRDIGPALSPMAYFAQFHLNAPAVAAVTGSHNPNGRTGVKMSFERPLAHGPEETSEVRDIVIGGQGEPRRTLPVSWSMPTLSPWCADTENDTLARIVSKLEARASSGGTPGGPAIKEVVTVNGARVVLDNGAWGLVRASSNTPNLVVVCESPESAAELRAVFADPEAIIRTEPGVGDYDQTF